MKKSILLIGLVIVLISLGGCGRGVSNYSGSNNSDSVHFKINLDNAIITQTVATISRQYVTRIEDNNNVVYLFYYGYPLSKYFKLNNGLVKTVDMTIGNYYLGNGEKYVSELSFRDNKCSFYIGKKGESYFKYSYENGVTSCVLRINKNDKNITFIIKK